MERTGEVRGGNVNTRVVKLQPLNKDLLDSQKEDSGDVGRKEDVHAGAELKEERRDQRYAMIPLEDCSWDGFILARGRTLTMTDWISVLPLHKVK